MATHPTITMKPVDSSSVAAHGYDAESKTLAIQFKSGNKVYHYADVPPSMYEKLCGAKSLGSFFHQHIRDAFTTTPIKPEEKADGVA